LIVFLFCTPRRPPSSPLFPYTTLFRSRQPGGRERPIEDLTGRSDERTPGPVLLPPRSLPDQDDVGIRGSLARDREGPTEVEAASDRKSTRLNSSHDQISYAVFCLKKKN